MNAFDFFAQSIHIIYQQKKMGEFRFITKMCSKAPRHLTVSVRLRDNSKVSQALKLTEDISTEAGVKSVLAVRHFGVVSYQFEMRKSYWKVVSRSQLTKPLSIGLGENLRQVVYDEGVPHTLIAGSTGSGKSELIRHMLLNDVNLYSPRDFKMILLDQSNELTEFYNSAHLALPPAITPDQVEQAVSHCHQILAHRKAENIRDDFKLLLVADEGSEGFFTKQLINSAEQITQTGRKFNVNFLMGAQEPYKKEFPFLGNVNNRLVGRLDNAQTSALISGLTGLEAHKLTGAGDFLYVPFGEAVRLQAPLTTPADYEQIPRAEIQPVPLEPARDLQDLEPEEEEELPSADFVDFLGMDQSDSPAGGRPKTELDYDLVGYYMVTKLSIEQAAKRGIKRTSHNLHKTAAREIKAAANKYWRMKNDRTKPA